MPRAPGPVTGWPAAPRGPVAVAGWCGGSSDAAADLGRWLVMRLDGDDPDRARDRLRVEAVRAAQQAQAAEYFAKVAPRWDELRQLHVPEEAVERAILALMQGRVVDLLIDLGTGTG